MSEGLRPSGDLVSAAYRKSGEVAHGPMVQVIFANYWTGYVSQDEIRDMIVRRSVGKPTLRTVLDMLNSNASRDNIRRVIEGELGD